MHGPKNTIFRQASLRPEQPGLSLLELLIFLVVMAVAMTAALSMFISSRLSERQGEERRRASLAAEQKMDEIRAFIHKSIGNGKALDLAYQSYGPTPPSGLPWLATTPPGLAASKVSVNFDAAYISYISAQSQQLTGLDPFYDTNPYDGTRPNPRAIITVSIINSEAPLEQQFGYDYNNPGTSPNFGIDINGNGSRLIQTGFTAAGGAAGYNNTSPPPFPLDLNGNGLTTDAIVTNNFVILPVVISVQWQGAAGPQRYDLFSLLMQE